MLALGEVIQAHTDTRSDPETMEHEEGVILQREQTLLDLLTYLSAAIAGAKQWERIANHPGGISIEMKRMKSRPKWWTEKDESANG